MSQSEFNEAEEKWLAEWEKRETFAFDEKAKKVFSIDTPPPTVSGRMHIGHAFSYCQTDFIARFKRMQGFSVFYPFGYDDNGLATERFVEKTKNIRAKDFSRAEFIKICLETTVDAENWLKGDFKRIGLSCHDWSAYRTIDEKARAASQKSFLEIFREGRAYRKKAPTIYCTKCETAIAQAELEDREIDSSFNDLLFELENGEKIVISTTRPEMLAACVSIFVNPEDSKNSHLIGKKAKVPLYGFWVPILGDERADPEKGSGIVMCCTFGDQTDMEWYYAHNLPLKMVISRDGRMLETAGKYAGKKVDEARKEIIEDLRKAGFLAGQTPMRHTVNVHERCKTEIEIIDTMQWFIRYLDLKDVFVKRALKIKWVPEHMKNRYDNWINGLQWDWNISRQRYFGIPFPVWYCKKCGETAVAEESQLPADPLNDRPKKPCVCGSTEFEPEKDVLDTWATSSLTPQIALSWIDKPKFFKKMFPMNLRPQGHDIITLWAFNTIVKAHFHENKVPWKSIMVSGWALDPKGKKMSKSLGNVIEPKEMISKYSADCLRYWAATVNLGEDVPFQEKEFVSGKKFMVKLSNIANFIGMQTKGFDYRKAKPGLKLTAFDKWVLSQENFLAQLVSGSLEEFDYSRAMHGLRDFLWLEFADFYLEEVKHRIYGDDEKSKEAAMYCLQRVFLDCLKMLAVFFPFTAEEIMQKKFGGFLNAKSIHLENWPKPDKKMMSREYSEKGARANALISEIRKFKTENKKPMNSPVEVVLDRKEMGAVKEFIDDIRQTVKASEIKAGDKTEIKTG